MYSPTNEPQLTTAKNPVAPGISVVSPVTVTIAGYGQLGPDEQALINEIKAVAEQVHSLVTRVQHAVETTPHDQPVYSNPQRWAALGATDLQVGFMKLVRAVAQPTTF